MKEDTKLTTSGRADLEKYQVVNTPLYRASTILFPNVAAIDAAQEARLRDERPMVYGLTGTPTTYALEDAICVLEEGHRTRLFPSGLAAIAAALMSILRAGDHILVTDSAYSPTRSLCDTTLKKFGVEATYYAPEIGGGIAAFFKPNTKAVLVESPGSDTFEIQDIPAIAAVAHAKNAVVVMDNTWASPLYFKAFTHGVDLSVQAVTKYLCGHSDVLMGSVTANAKTWPALRDTARQLGLNASPDDCYLVLRGMRSLSVRLARHQENGLKLAHWLATRPEVRHVNHPALPSHPGHAIWKRDFLGASGLFAIELHPYSSAAIAAMLDGLKLFGMGYSWGGYASLILPQRHDMRRTTKPAGGDGPTLRIHAGLEDPEDLIADLSAGFDRLRNSV